MDKQKISRKEFLKTVAGFLLGATALRFSQLFKASPKNSSRLKEAKYYKRADQLAG